jgi:signal transduction histidine kinase
MAHDINSLAELIPPSGPRDHSTKNRIIYSHKLAEEIMIYLRDLSLRQDWYSCRQLFLGIFEDLIRPEGLKYETSIQDDLGYIFVDIELMEKVINTVVENSGIACQIEGSEIEIAVSKNPSQSPFINHDWLKITVRDDGPGIPKEYLSEVKKPLFTTWKEQGHTGLGLSIAEKILQAHGGSVYLSSEMELGTITTLYLPLYNDKI